MGDWVIAVRVWLLDRLLGSCSVGSRVCGIHAPHSPRCSRAPLACAQRLLPRMSYLPLLLPELAQHFSSWTLGWGQEHMWMESDGVPLRWHLPVGVLYDCAVRHHYDARTGEAVDDSRARSRPWRIVVHFQNFPVDAVRSRGLQACCVVEARLCLSHTQSVWLLDAVIALGICCCAGLLCSVCVVAALVVAAGAAVQ